MGCWSQFGNEKVFLPKSLDLSMLKYQEWSGIVFNLLKIGIEPREPIISDIFLLLFLTIIARCFWKARFEKKNLKRWITVTNQIVEKQQLNTIRHDCAMLFIIQFASNSAQSSISLFWFNWQNQINKKVVTEENRAQTLILMTVTDNLRRAKQRKKN